MRRAKAQESCTGFVPPTTTSIALPPNSTTDAPSLLTPPPMNHWLPKLLLSICLLGLGWMGFLIWIRYPDNHGAGPIHFRFFLLGVVVIALGLSISKSGFAFATVGCSLLGLLLTWIVDWRNVMVNYDKWIARGMPEWGQVEPSGSEGSSKAKATGEGQLR